MTATSPPAVDRVDDATTPAVVTRRTVVRASGWSVPVVAVAATAPAFAASVDPRGSLGIIPARFTGTRDYAPNQGAGSVTVTGLRVVNNGPDALPSGVLQYTLSIPPSWGVFITGGSVPSGWTVSGWFTTKLTLVPTSTAKGLGVGEAYDLADPRVPGGRNLTFFTLRSRGENGAATTGVVEATVAATKAVPNEFTPDSSSATVSGGGWSGN